MATKLSFAVVLSTLLIIGSGHTSSSSDPPSASTSDEGYEVPIVDVNPQDNTFTLNEEALANVLGHDKCRDLPVSVISIAGDQQKEKSLLLNYILLYLRHGDKAQGKPLGSNWLEGLPSAHVTGFAPKEEVDSLNMWSEPYVVPVKDKKTGHNQDTCVVLMETQGFFDKQNSRKNTAQIFGLSSMVSSKTIHVSQNLQEADLEKVEIFADYVQLGKKQQQDGNMTPFQDLLFVIEHSPNAEHEYPYGFDGGQKYIDSKINDKGGKNIRSLFQSVSGFLLPSPGRDVNAEDFDGRKSLNPAFVKNMQEFVHRLVSSDHLVQKRNLMGNEVSGIALFEYFKAYFGIFNSSTLPRAAAILEATTEASKHAASTLAKDHYTREIMSYLSSFTKAIDPVELEVAHRKFVRNALDVFEQNFKKEQGNNPTVDDAQRQDVVDYSDKIWKLVDEKCQAAWAERIKVEHRVAIFTAKEHYIKKIGQSLEKEKYHYVEPEVLRQRHIEAVKSATDIYNEAEKVGTEADHDTYATSLMLQLGEENRKFEKQNEYYLSLIKQFSKNELKKMWQKKKLRKLFKEELKARIQEADDERKALLKQAADAHFYAWNLLGSYASTIATIMTLATMGR